MGVGWGEGGWGLTLKQSPGRELNECDITVSDTKPWNDWLSYTERQRQSSPMLLICLMRFYLISTWLRNHGLNKVCGENIHPFPNLHRRSLGKDRLIHPTLYIGRKYSPMMGLELLHIIKRGPRLRTIWYSIGSNNVKSIVFELYVAVYHDIHIVHTSGNDNNSYTSNILVQLCE